MTTANPTFSVVVNTNNRAGPLRTLLRTLEHQSYPHFEVIVVVGPTRDSTFDVLSEYQGRVRVLHCPKANLGQSRNVGLAASRGDIVAFIDDDAVPSRRWLEQMARLFQNPALDASGGAVYLIHPKQPAIQHRIGIMSSLAEQIDVRPSWLEHLVPEGAGCQWVGRMMGTNMAYRRQALLDIGGFDEYFVWVFDDADIALRLSNAGKTVHPVKEMPVYHIPASSGRRVAYSYNVKWWIHTKSAIYISIKSGRAAGDSLRSIVLRCLHLVHGHWLWSGQLWREKKLSFPRFVKMRLAEIRSAADGMMHGFFLPRKLLSQSSAQAPAGEPAPVHAFLDDDSPNRPAVDPVSGYRPAISLPESPLRICLLSSAYPPTQYEGVGRLTNLMARGLFECGHAVHVITRGEKEEVAFYDGAYVHRLPVRLDRYARYRHLPSLYYSLNHSHQVYESVKRLILNEGIQIVDSPLWQFDGLVTAVSGMAPVVVRLVTALRQISALQDEHNDDARLMGDMEQALIEHAAHLLPNTQATHDTACRVYGVSPRPDQYTIVPYGIIPAPDDEVRPFELGREKDELTALYVGRLEKRKGILDLFEAIPLVLEQIPKARFIIAGGDNSQHDGFQRRTGITYPTYFANRYRTYARRVEFTGRVSDETLQHLYQSCDLFVAPSLFESFGLIYLEAMNYAKPVIGCRGGGVPEVIDHGQTGLVTEPQAPAALAEAMVSLLQSPVKLREMGLAGRRQVLERFNYIQMARNFARVYRAVIRQSGQGSET